MHTTTSPVIYTIIVTYNGAAWIRKCLSALALSSVHEYTIVIDNASADNTVSIVQNEFPYVELLQNAKNLGFGAANNKAMETAIQRKADYLFLLNQDAYVYPDTIEQMLKIMYRSKEFGIVSPVQLSSNARTLDANFKTYLKRACSNAEIQAVEQKKKADRTIVPVRFVNAAAWLLRAQVVTKTGYFHPLFFHYGEDNNYSSRVQYHGFQIGICLASYVVHDRKPIADKQQELLRKIKTIVRYSATDIRKSFAAAYLQAVLKYFSLHRKAAAYTNSAITAALQVEWAFLKNIPAIKSYRKEMKNFYSNEY